MQSSSIIEHVQYNVSCFHCGAIWQPPYRSSLWWRAKQRSDAGFLDALHVSAEDCGCVEKQHRPEANFRVFGYDDFCQNFDLAFDSFVDAVKAYRQYYKGSIVFIKGVSKAVEQKLQTFH